MKLFKKYWPIILILVVLIAVGLLIKSQSGDTKQLSDLKKAKPNLAEFVDNIIRIKNTQVVDDKQTTWYLELGLAWKSLADRTQNIEHYRQALKAYEAGIIFTRRTNTVLINNAGNMAIYVKDYAAARQYYEEATRIAPGDPEAYIRLVDLHIDYLKSDKQTILAILDSGISRMPDPGFLTKKKESYLQSLK